MYMYIVTSFMKESWHLVNMIHIPIQNNSFQKIDILMEYLLYICMF